jgi:DeoR/GlpR family transcriptional regulator of sugar metabolism
MAGSATAGGCRKLSGHEQKITQKKATIAQKAAALINGKLHFVFTGTTKPRCGEGPAAGSGDHGGNNSPAIAAELLHHPLCEVIITGDQISVPPAVRWGHSDQPDPGDYFRSGTLSAAARWIRGWG